PGSESGSRALSARPRFRCAIAPGTPDDPHLPARASTAEEPIAPVGFEAGNARARRHFDLLQDLSGLRVDSPQLALVPFPRRMPELTLHPGHARDEAVGFDGAQDGARIGIDLMDPATPILSDPERSLRPCEPGISTPARCGDGGQHAAGLRVDLVDPVLGNLKEVLAVKGRSRMRRDIDRSQHRSALGVDGFQLLAVRDPNIAAVVGDSVDAGGALERSILFDDVGGRSVHDPLSVALSWLSD